jgi:hypothetical protein
LQGSTRAIVKPDEDLARLMTLDLVCIQSPNTPGINMKTIAVSFAVFSMLFSPLIISPVAQAGDISFTPRASISFARYKFSQTARPGALAPTGINGDEFPEVTFDVTFKLLGVGGTFFKEGYYLDIAAAKSADEEDSFTFEEASFKETFKGDRQDFSLTIGMKILDNMGGIYAGYKTGKSQADGNQGQSLSFEEKGLFIGANYAWQVSDNGLVSVNFAYADLKGDLVEEVTYPDFASLPIPLDIDATSDAQGLSYGISWSSRWSDSISYSLSLDAKNYTFDNIKDKNPDTITSKEFEEKFLNATVSLFFQF